MPVLDPSNILFTIAHPDLYERNPFNVLNLSVNATAKDIRRRREDIEAAFDAGTEADEFAGMIPADERRKTPTRAEVDDLFAALEDPEKRIAYALFWFWPSETDPATDAKSKRDPNAAYRYEDAIRKWQNRVYYVPSAESVAERHNLAVFNHLMGLGYERTLLVPALRTAQTPADVDSHWREGIREWNVLADDLDLWHSVSEFVTALNDPRLDYRFARSLRDQFAYAFDQINVELAIEFAKTGREADAKRQVAYMKLSQPGSDDVEGTFDDAFSGLLKQTEAIVDAALTEAKAKPKDGLKQANAVLNQTAEPLRVSRIVLDKGSPVRDAIVSAVFDGVRGCLIAYGNETKDWTACLKLTENFKGIAETENQRKIVEKDLGIIASNLLKQTEAVVDAALAEVKTNPKNGLKMATEVLNQTAEPLRVARIVLDKGSPIRNAIVSAVFAGVRGCLIAYGNETNDWDQCLKLNDMQKSFIETDDQFNLWQKDMTEISTLAERRITVDNCWICNEKIQANEKQASFAYIPLYGKLQTSTDKQSVRYKTLSIPVPVCLRCLHRCRYSDATTYTVLPEAIAHPFVLSAIKEGWRIGRQISQESVTDHLKEDEYTLFNRDRTVNDKEQKIKCFHNWCRAFEQAFEYLGKLDHSKRLSIAQLLFDSIHQHADDPSSVFALLRIVANEDEFSIRGHYVSECGLHIDSADPNYDGWISPAPLFKAYLNGFDFLSLLHYQRYPFHNPFHANEQLFKLLKRDLKLVNFPISASQRIVEEIRRGRKYCFWKYGRGLTINAVCYTNHSNMLGFSSSNARLSLNISLECLSSGIYSPFMQIHVLEMLKSPSVQDLSIVVKKVVSNFRKRYRSDILVQQYDSKQLIETAENLVLCFMRLLASAIDQTEWNRTGLPISGVQYGYGKDAQMWKRETITVI